LPIDNGPGKKAKGAQMKEWSEYSDTANKADVLRQLQELGYDLTQRTFYRHCQQGKCRTSSAGLYSRRLVKQYLEAEGIKRTGEAAGDDNGPDLAESLLKQRLENQKLDWHNKNAELDFKKKAGALIERDGVYLEIAARYVTLDNAFRQKIETAAPEIIAAVGGDLSRLLEFNEMITTMWDEMLNSFVTMDEFEVLFTEEEANGN
jgi:hypothetical protein